MKALTFRAIAVRTLALILPFATAFAFSRPALAGQTIAADLDYAAPVDTKAPAEAKSGVGFAIRIGQEAHLPFAIVNPEIGFTYDAFTKYETPKVYRGILGLRLGFGEILRPGIYGHVAIAHLDLSPPAGALDASHTAFSFDAGAFLDFTALPLLNVGIHAAYNNMASGDHVGAFQWVTLGAHAALVL